jgi:hypothetical protein
MAMNDLPTQAPADTTVNYTAKPPGTGPRLPLTVRSGRGLTVNYAQMGVFRLFAEHCDPRTAPNLILEMRAYLSGDSKNEPLPFNRVAVRILLQGLDDLLFDLLDLR